MTDKSLTATVRDADMRVLATLTLGSAHENFWSGRCTCEGKPVFAVIENGEHDFENGVMNGVRFSRSYIMIGEVVHLVDIANEGWCALIGYSIGAGPVPKPEMVQLLDSRTHECIEKINEHANRAASRVIESTGVASHIDKLVKSASAKINENANAIFSRVAEERDRVLAATASLDKLARDNSKRFHESATAAGKAAADMRALDDRVKIAQNDLEELAHILNIVRAGAESVEAMLGQSVRLKSGGFSMTAARMADDGGILCFWSNADGTVMMQSIPARALEVVGNDNLDPFPA